jgi:hypothetical protein
VRTSELPISASNHRQQQSISPMLKPGSPSSILSGKYLYLALIVALLMPFLASVGVAEECRTGSDLDDSVRSALETTAQHMYQSASQGNASDLQQNAIPSVASDFGGIQTAVNDNKSNFGPTAAVRNVYLFDAAGNAVIPRAEFFCGIVNSSDYAAFQINNLPPAKYGLVILDAQGGKSPMSVSFILQQNPAGQWKLGGFYARPSSIAGHDGPWYLAQARDYKNKGQNHNAWLYYLEAGELMSPVPFMSTPKLEKLYDEAQQIKPADLPGQQALDLTAAGKTYHVTQLFAVPVNDALGLVVKYQVPDVSNTTQAYADNMAVIKALVTRYPEFRDAFGTVVARAVQPDGRDYGTLLAIKDLK